MAGLCTTPGCEVDQILQARIIKPEQFHGVEIVKDIYDANVEAWPNLAWHHGDFLQVMQKYSRLQSQPGQCGPHPDGRYGG